MTACAGTSWPEAVMVCVGAVAVCLLFCFAIAACTYAERGRKS